MKTVDLCDMTTKAVTEIADEYTKTTDYIKTSPSQKNILLHTLSVDDCCPQPNFDVPAPSLRCENDDSTVLPETLRASDLDTTDVSEFTIDPEMMDNFAKNEVNVDIPDCQMTPFDNKIKPRCCSTFKKNTQTERKIDVDMPVFETESLYSNTTREAKDSEQNVKNKSSSNNVVGSNFNLKDLKELKKQSNFVELPQVSLAPKKNLIKRALDEGSRNFNQTKVVIQNQSEKKVNYSPISVLAKKKKELNMEIKSLYKPRHDAVPAASKTFVAPIRQQGLSLSNVLRY